MPVPFVHLHNRSEYSLLRSTLRIRDLIRLAAAHGMPAVALTDRMNLHGLVQFHDHCYRHGVRPIIGAELALEPIAATSIDSSRPATFDLVVLAENNTGYERLCDLLSRAHLDTSTPFPVVRLAWLEELAGHWFILSGGLDGEVFQHTLRGDDKRARDVAGRLAHIAGPNRFFIELQWHQLASERIVLPKLLDLARHLNIPAVATNQCACASRSEAPALDLLRRIDAGDVAASPEALTPESDLFHVRSHEEMASIFRNAPEAVANSLIIANQCAVEFHLGGTNLMPHVEPPPGKSNRAVLEAACHDGLVRRYPDWLDDAATSPHKLTKKKRHEIGKRIEFEIETITGMGFVSYFLIVADFVRYARDSGIPVGPGRGSAAGSLVSFLLGITDIDPLDFGLLFERFLNPSRKKMPDIDIDFCERRRGEVIRYVREKYGAENVAQIATFSTFRARLAVRDTCRMLSVKDTVADRLCAMLNEFQKSHEHGRSGLIPLALDNHEPLRELYHQDATVKQVLDLARGIEDLPRNLSTHAAGVVISPKPLRTILPLTRGADGEFMTQFDMYAVERFGLLKIDFLGLTTLTVLDDAGKLIMQSHGAAPVLADLPLDDDATFALLQRGDVLGVFQLETSGGMRRLVQDMRLSSFADLIAVLALYRPGAMHASGAYVDRKLGREQVSFPHPKLEPVLKETFGIFLYQEQVMQCLHVLAGYTLAEADIFRQIMSKKMVDLVASERTKFIDRMVEKGTDHDAASRLFDLIAQFANYGFNKSHATAYAFIAYWTAYLKAHYPAEFFASIFNSKMDTPDKFAECFQDCRSNKVAVLVPDVNASAALFTVAQYPLSGTTAIRFALDAIRNVGPAAAAEIVREREANGPYKSIDDLCRRVNHRTVNRKALEFLVKAGACDCFATPRQRLCLIVDDTTATWERAGESELQRSFFESIDEPQKPKRPVRTQLDAVGEWDATTRLAFEKEAIGIYLTGHPLDRFAASWRALVTADSRQTGFQPDSEDDPRVMAQLDSQRNVVMAGMVLSTDWRMSKKGSQYGIVKFEDLFGTFEALLWSEHVAKYRAQISQGQTWCIQGMLRAKFGRMSLEANILAPADQALRDWPRKIQITLHHKRVPQQVLAQLADVLKKHPGSIPVDVVISSATLDKPVAVSTASLSIQPAEDLFQAIEQLGTEVSTTCHL